MAELALPTLRAADWHCCLIEEVELAGRPFWVATVPPEFGGSPVHRWYPDHNHALAYAAEHADRCSLPLFDFSTGESE